MREIKFRAWDKENKEMLYFKYKGVTRPTQGGYAGIPKTDFWDGERKGKRNARLEFDNIEKNVTGYNHDDFNEGVESELMQYTGLKDKNGVEICEGDIVNAKIDTGVGSYFYDKGEVLFHTEVAQYILSKRGMCTNIGNNVEVIGNIYENPDLIK